MPVSTTTIIASADDALQNGVSVNLTGATPTINATNKHGGFRFQNVAVPKWATITAATISLYFPSMANDDPDVNIWAEKAVNAPEFTATNNDITNRTPTTAVVQWTASSVGSGWEASADISSIIQELVSMDGWLSPSSIVLILQGRSTNPLRYIAYDDGSGTYATLDVTWYRSLCPPRRAQTYIRM